MAAEHRPRVDPWSRIGIVQVRFKIIIAIYENGRRPMTAKIHDEGGQEIHPGDASSPLCGKWGPPEALKKAGGFEWKSRIGLFGIPVIHIAFGCDERGKMRVAKGFIAIGQFAVGAITFCQVGIGVLFAFGQLTAGLVSLGQFAIGLLAAGQLVAGWYGVGQAGWGRYLWTPERTDMEAVALFYTIIMRIGQFLCIDIP